MRLPYFSFLMLNGIKPKFLWKPDAFTENFVQVGSTEKLGGYRQSG